MLVTVKAPDSCVSGKDRTVKKRGWLWKQVAVEAAVISLLNIGCGKTTVPMNRPSSDFSQNIESTSRARIGDESEDIQGKTEKTKRIRAAEKTEPVQDTIKALTALHLFVYPKEYEGEIGSFHFKAEYDLLNLQEDEYPELRERIQEYNRIKEEGAKNAGNFTISRITVGRADAEVVSFSEQFIYSREFHTKHNWETETGREIRFSEVVTDPDGLYEYLERQLLRKQEIASEICLYDGWEAGLRERVDLGQDGLCWYLKRGRLCVVFDCSNFPYADGSFLVEIPVSDGNSFLEKTWFYTLSDYEKDVKAGKADTPLEKAAQTDQIADSLLLYFFEDLQQAEFADYDAYYDGYAEYPRWISVHNSGVEYVYDAEGNLIRAGIPEKDHGNFRYIYYEKERFTGDRAPDDTFYQEQNSEKEKESRKYLLEAEELYRQSECSWD